MTSSNQRSRPQEPIPGHHRPYGNQSRYFGRQSPQRRAHKHNKNASWSYDQKPYYVSREEFDRLQASDEARLKQIEEGLQYIRSVWPTGLSEDPSEREEETIRSFDSETPPGGGVYLLID